MLGFLWVDRLRPAVIVSTLHEARVAGRCKPGLQRSDEPGARRSTLGRV